MAQRTRALERLAPGAAPRHGAAWHRHPACMGPGAGAAETGVSRVFEFEYAS